MSPQLVVWHLLHTIGRVRPQQHLGKVSCQPFLSIAINGNRSKMIFKRKYALLFVFSIQLSSGGGHYCKVKVSLNVVYK